MRILETVTMKIINHKYFVYLLNDNEFRYTDNEKANIKMNISQTR